MAVYPERRKGRLTGKWIAEITRDGVRVARKSFDTKKDGEAWEGYMKLTGSPPPAETVQAGPSVDEVAREYLETLPAGADPSGRARLEYAIGVFGKATPIAEIDERTLDRLVRDLKKRPSIKGDGTLSPGTINRYLSAASGLLTFAKLRKRVERTPTIPWQEDDGKRLHWLTEPQEKALMRYFEAQDGADWAASTIVCKVLIQTGMRWGELARLTAGQIEVENGWIRLWKTKNGKARSVPIERSLARSLKFLVSTSGVPKYSTFRNRLMTAAKSVGLAAGFSIHALRHTTATRLMQRGVVPQVVQKYLGHKTIITTMKYTHVADEDLQSALEKLSPHAGQTDVKPKQGAA